MTAQIISFPPRRSACVWMLRDDGCWLVLAGEAGWLHDSSVHALQDAAWLAENFPTADQGVNMMTLTEIARRLGGEVSGRQVSYPGPGHSSEDRSLSVKLNVKGDDIVVYSHSDDDVIGVRITSAKNLACRLSPQRRRPMARIRARMSSRDMTTAMKLASYSFKLFASNPKHFASASRTIHRAVGRVNSETFAVSCTSFPV